MAKIEKKVILDKTVLDVQRRSDIKVINIPTDYVFQVPFAPYKSKKILHEYSITGKTTKKFRKKSRD